MYGEPTAKLFAHPRRVSPAPTKVCEVQQCAGLSPSVGASYWWSTCNHRCFSTLTEGRRGWYDHLEAGIGLFVNLHIMGSLLPLGIMVRQKC